MKFPVHFLRCPCMFLVFYSKLENISLVTFTIELKYTSFKSTIPSFNLSNLIFWLYVSFRTSENQENQTSNSTAEKGEASRQQFLCVDGGKNKIKEVDQIISNVAAFIENNDVRKQTFRPRAPKR